MLYLEVVDGKGRRRQVELNRQRLLIGREPSCDIHLPHPGVSRRHAQLQETEKGRWMLQDLDSRNKVYIENRAVKQTFLEIRKPFRIAEYWLALQESKASDQRELEHHADLLPETIESHIDVDEGEWLESLQKFQRSLRLVHKPSQVLADLAEEFRRILAPQIVATGLVQTDGYKWQVHHGGNDESLLAQAQAKVEEDHSSAINWVADVKTENDQTPNRPPCLLFPMKGRSGVIGHVYVARPSCAALPKTVQRYFSVLATQAGLMYENMKLNQLREFEAELDNAREIQLGLFPATYDVDDRLDAYGINLPSTKVSGDYYDLIKTGPDSVAFVIADAMGHGMPAALLMAAVRAVLRVGLTLELDWADVFRGLDELIVQARSEQYVTGMVGMLNLKDEVLTIVSAGHPLPSILVDGESVAVPEKCHTRPWGIEFETPWVVGRLSLKGKRWSILGYTDGITEPVIKTVRAETGKPISGSDWIVDFHKEYVNRSAEDVCNGLISEVAMASNEVDDDQTVLVLCSPAA